MDRKELLSALALAAGLSITAQASAAVPTNPASESKASEVVVSIEALVASAPSLMNRSVVLDEVVRVASHKSKGFERSGNPKAAGGPANPGKGNPHGPY